MSRLTFNAHLGQEEVKPYEGKRLVDITGSIILIVLFSPLFLIVTIAILIFSGTPVFFYQTRSGLHGDPFVIYKFRTMVHNESNNYRRKYFWNHGVPDNFVFKSNHDQTVTKIGRYLRKYSIDEIPQLFNVLKGDMSLVGPRPEIVEITNCYDQNQAKRLLMKPGLTGYAQVNGRSDITHGQKVELDRYYVEQCSFWLDIRIIVKTILLVISGKGAY